MGVRWAIRSTPYRVAAGLARLCCIVLPLLMGFAGCSWFEGPEEIDTRTIDVQVSPKANHNAAVAVDLVYVFNPQLLTQLQTLGAKDWFRQRDELRALYPTEVSVSSYELVPGQRGPIEKVSSKNTDAIGLFAFANYQDDGAHRARLDRFEHAQVLLKEGDIAVVSTAG
jgi:type VI secretion system protein